MKRLKYVVGILIIFSLISSIIFASPNYKGPMLYKERIMILDRNRYTYERGVPVSQDLQNLLRERNRIQAEIQLLLREEKIDSEKLQQKIKELKNLNNKIYEEWKKNLLSFLDKNLKLKEDQKEKVKAIFDKYLDALKELRLQIREKTLQARALGNQDKEKLDQLKKEISDLRIKEKNMEKEMWKEISNVLDKAQVARLRYLLMIYNRKAPKF
jgi:DNA repair exonuclease SbcCD ATPase subunit